MILFRPVGMAEPRLVYEAGLRSSPPRLPEQIARDWNTKSRSFAGYVTRFEVEDDYVSRFEKRFVGGREHEELWVPAEELEDFNRHIVGLVGVVDAYFGPLFVGHVPAAGSFEGKGAVDQLVMLAGPFGEAGRGSRRRPSRTICRTFCTTCSGGGRSRSRVLRKTNGAGW